MKLHIGCGDKFLEGFRHVDVISYPHVDYLCDASDLQEIADGCVSEIYACHVLEHFRRQDIPKVLQEWARVLESGGRLRLAVPDFSAVAQEYVSSGRLTGLQGLLYGGQTYDYNFHHLAFDFDSLIEYLQSAGYGSIQKYDWRDFLPDEYDDYSRAYLPHMDFQGGRLMSLNVVATKRD